MNPVPFSETCQLNRELELNDDSKGTIALRRTEASSTTLPGQARVELGSPDLDEYLGREFLVPHLDKLAPILWLVSTPLSSHISAIHHQAVRGREIVLAENPHLHLVWSYDRIFIKPIPRYLLSHAFWQYLASQPAGTGDVVKAVTGFMRSYAYLIQYETDFNLAQDKGLIPKSDGTEAITWDAFARLITRFERFEDTDVSPRFSYGELRLTRLNFYSRIFLGKLTFHHIDAQWGSYLNRFIAPLLAIFAIASIILNAMQVELSVQSLQGLDEAWSAFTDVSRWFSVITLFVAAISSAFMIILITFMFCHDIWFARNIIKKKGSLKDVAWKKIKSGVV